MQQNPGRTKLRTLALMTGMGLMIPCYLFTVGNIWFSPWPLYARNRVAIVVLTVLCALGLLAAFGAIGRHEAFLTRHRRRILAFAALFYLLVQILMGLALRFTPITDTEQCFTAAQLLELPIFYVATVHFHAAGANVIAAGKKIDDGGFA